MHSEPKIPRAVEDFADRLEPIGRILNMMNDGFAIWSCCPIRGDDGLVHVFATIWEHKGDYTLPPQVGMSRGSRIARFTAEQPEGPYMFREIALEPAGGDAWDGGCVSEGFVYRVENRYAMVYFGDNANSEPKHPIQVGLAVADSLDGPWVRVSVDKPIIPVGERDEDIDSHITANPALVMPPGGGYWLYYKGNSKAVKAASKQRTDLTGRAAQHGVFRTVCLARAENLEGPYQKYEGNPVIRYEHSDFEDPYVWHDGERFHMLGHDLSVLEYGAGIYLQSFDGIHWSEPAKGYPSAKTMTGHPARIEEPAVLFNADGEPEYLFCNKSYGDYHVEEPFNPVFTGFLFKVRPKLDTRVANLPRSRE